MLNIFGIELTTEQIKAVLEELQNSSNFYEEKVLTVENWKKEFPNQRTKTPIGEVKLGEMQFEKLVNNNRVHYFGMIKPTLKFQKKI